MVEAIVMWRCPTAADNLQGCQRLNERRVTSQGFLSELVMKRRKTPKQSAFTPLPAASELAATSVERLLQSVSVTCFLSTDVGVNKQPLGRYERLTNLLPGAIWRQIHTSERRRGADPPGEEQMEKLPAGRSSNPIKRVTLASKTTFILHKRSRSQEI